MRRRTLAVQLLTIAGRHLREAMLRLREARAETFDGEVLRPEVLLLLDAVALAFELIQFAYEPFLLQRAESIRHRLVDRHGAAELRLHFRCGREFLADP